jgi:hypothetical protein
MSCATDCNIPKGGVKKTTSFYPHLVNKGGVGIFGLFNAYFIVFGLFLPKTQENNKKNSYRK